MTIPTTPDGTKPEVTSMTAAPKKQSSTNDLDGLKTQIEKLDEQIKTATTVKITDVRNDLAKEAEGFEFPSDIRAALNVLTDAVHGDEAGMVAVALSQEVAAILADVRSAANDHVEAVLQERRAQSQATELRAQREPLVKRYGALRTLAELDGADVTAYPPIGAPPARAAGGGSGTVSSRVRTFTMERTLNGKIRPAGESFSRFAMFALGSDQKGQTETLKKALAEAGITDPNTDWTLTVERSGKPVELTSKRVEVPQA